MIFSIFNSQFSIVNFRQSLTPEHWICFAGLIVLGYWLLRTSLGVKALSDSTPRRNDMPLYLPLIPLLLWFGPVPMAVLLARGLTQDCLSDWQIAFLDNCIFIVGGLLTTAVILLLARAHFARRLRGFGFACPTRLTGRTSLTGLGADCLYAFVNLLAVWPLIMAAIAATVFLGQYMWGQDYQMQKHQELQLIAEYSQLPLRITVVVAAAIMAPLLEELLFRGLVQTTIRSMLDFRFSIFDFRLKSPNGNLCHRYRQSAIAWLAIAASSGLFTVMHADSGHWPALFVLGVCLGYAYEKSGSLFRPVFIHAIFNTVSLAAALSQ